MLETTLSLLKKDNKILLVMKKVIIQEDESDVVEFIANSVKF